MSDYLVQAYKVDNNNVMHQQFIVGVEGDANLERMCDMWQGEHPDYDLHIYKLVKQLSQIRG